MDELEVSKVPYPDSLSETDVTYSLLKSLDDLGYEFRTEVKVEPRFGSRGARLDIVVYKDKVARAIIEVKRKDLGKATVQQKHYKELTGLPVIVCGGALGIPRTIDLIKKYL